MTLSAIRTLTAPIEQSNFHWEPLRPPQPERQGRPWHGSAGFSPVARGAPRDGAVAPEQAALEGVGIVQLPDVIVAQHIAAGRLEVMLPDWSAARGITHAVFQSRRGLLPAVRHFLDFLAAEMREP